MPNHRQHAAPSSKLRDLAHEIRTPLNALLGYADLIKAECRKNHAVDVANIDSYASTIEAAGQQLLRLCERMLVSTNGEVSRVELVSVDVNDLLEKVVALFMGIARHRGVALELSTDPDLPMVSTDPVLLTEIITNLVNNALRFTPAGGTVKVVAEVASADEALIFIVSDTGTGIPDHVLAKIREGKHVTTPSLHGSPGWGRGLAISNELCALLGTKLEFVQRSDGGTLVSFRQPLACTSEQKAR